MKTIFTIIAWALFIIVAVILTDYFGFVGALFCGIAAIAYIRMKEDEQEN